MLKNPQLFQMNIAPEEDITGYIARESFERSQGKIMLRPSTVAKSSKRPGWVFPSGIGKFEDEFLSRLPSVEQLIDDHTRYPLFEKFLSVDGAKELREHHKGNAIKGLAARVGLVSGGYRGRMAICPECVENDIKQHGYAIWHRLSLMPGIFACAEHSQILLTFCDACEIGHRRVKTNWRISARCSCGGELKPVGKFSSIEKEMAINIARMAGAILVRAAPLELSAELVTNALSNYFGVNQRPYEKLEDALGPDTCLRLGFGLLTLKRFVGSRRAEGPIRNPIQNLAVIHSVFGGLDQLSDYIHSCREQGNFGKSNIYRSEESKSKKNNSNYSNGEGERMWFNKLSFDEQVSHKFKCRKWLLENIGLNPGLSRSNIFRLPGGRPIYRFFLFIDREWFDKTLPVKDRKSACAAMKLKNIERVESLLQHIRNRHTISLKNRPMERITKSYLISNFSCESGTSSALDSEEVISLLNKLVETPEKWRARIGDLRCSTIVSSNNE